MTEPQRIRAIFHAPTAAALQRARRNAANLRQAEPSAEVRIIVNADGVAAALDAPDPAADALTHLCPNTLRNIGRTATAPLAVLDQPSVLALCRLQEQGWCYIRA